MTKMTSEWRVYGKKADFYKMAELYGISPYTARILRNRDLTDDKEIREYLLNDMERMGDWASFAPHLNDPGQFADMDRAVGILREGLEQGRKMRIIGDYDIDGICSIYILYRGLAGLGANVDWDIPDRIRDGYGLNVSFVEKALEEKVDLMITCDNGISAAEAIGMAKKGGMKVVVTDHHEVPKETDESGEERESLPPADAIVDPKRKECGYPFKGICGAVVAWKVMTVLYEELGRDMSFLYEMIPYAAIATVGDVMELVKENRILVKKGLQMIRETEDIGLLALMQAQAVNPSAIRAYHIGFVIGPVMNAGGRLDTAKSVVELLLCRDPKEAELLAKRLKMLNDQRKQMTEQGVLQAVAQIGENGYGDTDVLVIYLQDCHESIAGIIAGRIRERYNRPTIVLTSDAGGEVKGSGRSIPGYHMFEKLSRCRDLLDKFGGHPMAAGLSLKRENVDLLRQRLNEESGLTEQDFVKKVWIDIPLPPEKITFDWIRELSCLEPFGNGNEKPAFGAKNARIMSASVVGKERKILKMRVMSQEEGAYPVEAVYFRDPEEFLNYCREKFSAEDVEMLLKGKPNNICLNLLYYPDINDYQGRQSIQLVIEDFC